jgi:hypothetical protein
MEVTYVLTRMGWSFVFKITLGPSFDIKLYILVGFPKIYNHNCQFFWKKKITDHKIVRLFDFDFFQRIRTSGFLKTSINYTTLI